MTKVDDLGRDQREKHALAHGNKTAREMPHFQTFNSATRYADSAEENATRAWGGGLT